MQRATTTSGVPLVVQMWRQLCARRQHPLNFNEENQTVLNRNYKETADSRQRSMVATATVNVMHTNIGKRLGSLSQTGSTRLYELFHGGEL